jgi:hypothetical protein
MEEEAYGAKARTEVPMEVWMEEVKVDETEVEKMVATRDLETTEVAGKQDLEMTETVGMEGVEMQDPETMGVTVTVT